MCNASNKYDGVQSSVTRIVDIDTVAVLDDQPWQFYTFTWQMLRTYNNVQVLVGERCTHRLIRIKVLKIAWRSDVPFSFKSFLTCEYNSCCNERRRQFPTQEPMSIFGEYICFQLSGSLGSMWYKSTFDSCICDVSGILARSVVYWIMFDFLWHGVAHTWNNSGHEMQSRP